MRDEEVIREIDESLKQEPNAQGMHPLSLEATIVLWNKCPDVKVGDTTIGHIAQGARMMYFDIQLPAANLRKLRGALLAAGVGLC